jgi:LPS sulfotransferase NodH
MAKVPPPLLPALRRLARVRTPRPVYGPDSDLEWPGAATRSVVVACDGRTGSSLLCRALEDTGAVGAPGEFFDDDRISRAVATLGVPVPTTGARWRRQLRRLALRPRWYYFDTYDPSTFPAYVDEVIRRRTGPNGVFSAKFHWSQLERAVDRFGFDIATLPQPIAWIHLERHDLVAQAVSMAIVRQTGDFTRRPDGASPPPPALYDDDLLLTRFAKASRGVEKWNALFAAHGIDPIRVTYAELATDYDRAVRRVLDELGLSAKPVPPAGFERQAGAINADWAARFRSAHPDLIRGVPATGGD